MFNFFIFMINVIIFIKLYLLIVYLFLKGKLFNLVFICLYCVVVKFICYLLLGLK